MRSAWRCSVRHHWPGPNDSAGARSRRLPIVHGEGNLAPINGANPIAEISRGTPISDVTDVVTTHPARIQIPAEADVNSNPSNDNPAPPAAAPASAPAQIRPTTVAYEHFAQLDLRVARVLEAREHPNANKLLLLKIKVGEVEKQIVAGIRGHYEPAVLVGRLIVVVNNLAPAVIRGEESNGMLLAASDDTGVVLLQPDRQIAEGSKVK
jgi:methionine--tRNA ligase beta chain